MTENNSIRKQIFGLAAGFAAITIVIAVIACGVSLHFTFITELKYDRQALKNATERMEEHILEGSQTPFRTAEIIAESQTDQFGYMFAVLDKATGKRIVPEKMDRFDDYLQIDDNVKNFRKFRIDGKKYFTFYNDMKEMPLRVFYVSSYKFAFKMVDDTIFFFIICLLTILGIMLLITAKVILPKAEKEIRERHNVEQELEQASRLQKMAITRDFPKDARCDIFGRLKPAKEVGGDLYGCIEIDDNLYFIIGDVSDKGAQAAFVMFLLSSLAYPMFKSRQPLLKIAAELNNVLCDNPNYDMFCTSIIGRIDLTTGEMHYINAGHTRMMINGEFVDSKTNMPFGILRDYPFEEETINLPEGTMLLLYTDGVTEQRAKSRAFFGEEGLVRWWKSNCAEMDAHELCDSLIIDIEQWRGSEPQSDDMAIITAVFHKLKN